MRILVISGMRPSAADPQFGIFVARQVEALRRLGAQVELVGIERSPSGGLRTARKYLGLELQARRAARALRPDVVLAHLLYPPGEIARRVARRARAPLVVVAHGQDVQNAVESAGLRGRTDRVLAGAAACIVVSEALAGRLRSICDVPCPLHVLDVGVDLELYRPGDREVAAAALGGVEERPLVVQVGHLVPWKNPLLLADAVGRLRERTGAGTLWLAGGGPLAAELEGRPHVRLLGVVDPAEVPRLYRAADCAALVSLREGYGLAALEAVACGTPLVVSRDAPVAADLPADAAVVVDPGDADAIADGLEAALRLPRASEAGQAAAARHGLEAQTRRLLDLLATLQRQ